MFSISKTSLAAFAIATVIGAASANAQTAPAGDTPDVHLKLAKEAAGTDFLGTLGRLCILPATGPGADVAPGAPPARETWYADPAKVFDNLYFVGGKIHSAWALTTSDGIILIDTIYPYNSEELIVGGLQKLGLDPKQVKYVIITHGHGDHVGGAKMMQDRFGSRIVMGEPDWRFVENSVNRYGQGETSVKPKRDIVAQDGQKITLGDTTVTLVFTPGHTEGTFSLFFPVQDNGKPLTVAYSGGTAFNFVNTVENFQTYINSQRKMVDMAKSLGATVVMSNHSEFDNAVNKIRMIPGRKPGEPSPIELGADAVSRYFKVSEECARVAQLKLQQASKSN
ncbi:MBL fold metallo-hydrolase [Microvirga sp. HBU67558]|uniref:MBL fold metallo-hydrolase n=1 Tax=Microvirga TaxID=186650 RepID=UPI001B389AA8|nr:MULTISPECIES: MBL fold metallo-hydrolase [unclassified Microvirga]MBQ0821907.1 MBL fold metallo-hydrolase [Microvirga sp. HBU67558]